jgi:spore coat polysaccharide biosynthesis predicted glycosyltransferase SpsG
MNDLRFFVSMGGADLYNATEQILDFLQVNFPTANYKVLLGSAYKSELPDKFRVDKIETFRNLNAVEIIQLIKQCNIAICPASTIAYEAFCVNIPVITGFISEYQKYVASNFDKYKIAINVEDLRKPDNALKEAVHKVTSTYLSMMKLQREFFYGQQLNNLINLFYFKK